MKKILNILLVLGLSSALFSACVDKLAVGDAFLEKAPGVDVNIDTVFTSAEYTRNFLWSAYGQIYCIYTGGNMMNGAPIDALSDSYHCYVSWGGPKQSYYGGAMTEDAQDTEDGNFQGKFSYSTIESGLYDEEGSGGRVSIYETVRKCWQLIDNIERVPDMSDDEKSRLKGEAYTIMASRYYDAFRNFGGLCLARKAYEVGENFTGGRSTAMETVEFIDSLIVCAINEPGFIWSIPDADIGQWSGRLTRASARALRAKVWMFAASPLFNNKEPYMTYTSRPTGLENEEHVWFGKEDPTLWNRCLQYCNDFFEDNARNGNYYELIQPASQDEAGYRTAFRRAYRYRNDATHHEKLFDAHPTQLLTDRVQDGQVVEPRWGWGWPGFGMDCLRQGGSTPTNELMECFGMQDGRNYPYANLYGAGKNPEGVDIFADRDPRLYETMLVPRQSLPAGFEYANYPYTDTWINGAMENDATNFATNAKDGEVATGYRKFKWLLDYQNDKMNDEFIGVPYIRLAEMYLIRAEAKAETGDLSGALDDLHVVRSRVGLGRLEKMNPSLNLTSNKENLINEILRERNCEIGAEAGDRVYDMIRRKRQDLFTKPLHEMKIYRLDDNGNRLPLKDDEGNITNLRWDPSTPWPKMEYEIAVIVDGARRWWEPGFWTNKWYLDPVSRIEVQKKYGLTQNPGW